MIRNKDLAKHLSKEIWVSEKDWAKIVNIIFDKIKKELLNGSDVTIYEFLTLGVKEAIGRNVVVPSTKVFMEAKNYKKVFAKFSVSFRNKIKKS